MKQDSMQIIDATQSLAGLEAFLSRREANIRDVTVQTAAIRHEVTEKGWEGLADLTLRFDGVKKSPCADSFRVTRQEFESASNWIAPPLREAIQVAIKRVRTFHQKQKRTDWFHEEPGIRTGQLFRPLDRVGVYAPGGEAVLFSTLIMNVIPAQVAGCPEIVVCSPPQKSNQSVSPLILGTCALLGLKADQIWSIGGAQAIFAMAFGLQGFPAVHGVFGPGNAYVMEAKRQVQGEVRIESLPGHSEILIIADPSADPAFIAADFLSQAEHAGGEMCLLVTDSRQVLDAVQKEVETQLDLLERKEVAQKSISTGGALILVRNLCQAVEISNRIAPEHLEIQTEDPQALLSHIRHAGAVFIGPWSTEPIGDYTAGTNHVLPTGGHARISSALSVDDFIKKISLVHLEPEGLENIGPAAMKLAEAEGLTAHQAAIRIRLDRIAPGSTDG